MCTDWIMCTPKFKIRCCCVFFRHRLHSGGYPPGNIGIKKYLMNTFSGSKDGGSYSPAICVIAGAYIVQMVQHRNRHQKSSADVCAVFLIFADFFAKYIWQIFKTGWTSVKCTLTPNQALNIITACFADFCWSGLVSQIMNTTSIANKPYLCRPGIEF